MKRKQPNDGCFYFYVEMTEKDGKLLFTMFTHILLIRGSIN